MSANVFSEILCDESNSISERFRALFELRNLRTDEAVAAIGRNFNSKSALLKHELAYCLGQMKNTSAIPILISVLRDNNQETIVRHEAAEALAAIEGEEAKSILQEYKNDEAIEVAETCDIGIQKLNFFTKTSLSDQSLSSSNYNVIDPAPSFQIDNIDVLKGIYLGKDTSLFDRYRAMFSLRNLQNSEAALVLCAGFKHSSALFKHEVAFVLGQLQDEKTIPALAAVLADTTENLMVRHECAEALGSIGNVECFDILNRFLDDKEPVVRESCEVAIDMMKS